MYKHIIYVFVYIILNSLILNKKAASKSRGGLKQSKKSCLVVHRKFKGFGFCVGNQIQQVNTVRKL